jgi:hypothetical protein
VLPGRGSGNLTGLFHELNRLNLRPMILTLDTSGIVNAPADLFAAIDAFEAAVQPACGGTSPSCRARRRFDAIWRSRLAIRRGHPKKPAGAATIP